MNFNYTMQISLNLAITILITGYSILLHPLKRKIDVFNLIFSEICIGICFSLVLLLSFFSSEQSKKVVDNFFLFTMIGFLGIKSLISFILMYLSMKKIWFKYEIKRALEFASKISDFSLEK